MAVCDCRPTVSIKSKKDQQLNQDYKHWRASRMCSTNTQFTSSTACRHYYKAWTVFSVKEKW